jgi:hypothetical protein
LRSLNPSTYFLWEKEKKKYMIGYYTIVFSYFDRLTFIFFSTLRL